MHENFFSKLKATDDLYDFHEEGVAEKLPKQWHIFVADVLGSTRAISDGKYKSVNSVSVAAIAAVLNVTKEIANIPYVFGGDGATFCIPEDFREKVKIALLGTQQMAKEAFDLELVVGAVSIEEIRSAGYEVYVGKYRVSEHYYQATFSGGGLSYAEMCVKDKNLDYQFEPLSQKFSVNFEGFECRWKNIPSPHGETVAYLIKFLPPWNQKNNYEMLLKQFEKIYGEPKKRHPLAPKKMKLGFRFSHFQNEFRIKTYFEKDQKKKYLWRMFIQNLIGGFCMFFSVRYKDMLWGNYKVNAIENSDICKFDDMLRLIVSGNAAQRKEIELFLEKFFKEKKMAYGLHVSDAATMTCYVENYAHDHYHFVDGSDGGYAMASIDFKKRIRFLEKK